MDRETIKVPVAAAVAQLYRIEFSSESGPMLFGEEFTWGGAHRWLADRPELALYEPRVVPA